MFGPASLGQSRFSTAAASKTFGHLEAFGTFLGLQHASGHGNGTRRQHHDWMDVAEGDALDLLLLEPPLPA